MIQKLKWGIAFISMSIAAYAGVTINGQSMNNNSTVVLNKNVSKQDVGLQGGGLYYLLQNIPVTITDSSQYKIVCSSDSLSTIFSTNTNFYLQFAGNQVSLPLLSAQTGSQVMQGNVNGTLNTMLSFMVQGQNPVVTTQLGNAKVCNFTIYYGDNLANYVTVQLVITYDPANINKPDGNAKDLQKPNFTVDNLVYDLGENNHIGQTPTVTSLTQTAYFYTATRNLVVSYQPGYVEDCGVPYGFSAVVNNGTGQVGAFSTGSNFYANIPASQDQYTPFPFALTVFPLDTNAKYTKQGVISINGQFIVTYFE